MPPKRRPATRTTSQQSTLAFHGSTNKVTKSGTRAQQPKKNLLDTSTETKTNPDVVDVSATTTDDEAVTVEQPETPVVAPQATSTPEEDEARAISEEQIKEYWDAKVKDNVYKKDLRVHQTGVSVHEKILRDFDMDSRFGPCVGIDRTRRWKRANRLGLKQPPPIEVLAVLLKEHESDKKNAIERSRVDELLNAHNLEVEP